MKTFLKRITLGVSILIIIVCLLGVTPFSKSIKIDIAKKLMSTRYQDETWILVGKEKRDELIEEFEEKYLTPVLSGGLS